ncbi:hypothetical protein ABT246_01190 [Streptomyces sp. NPDC001553]|uniref:hypothetical protein n=1 Tax=Streptomyces sp. NPDC001553 TaxID=3154385 RepID=UPI003330957E
MARSTIQEKLSGKTPAKLSQILALVGAIAEFGRINNTPLTPQEIDENSWRARYVAATGSTSRARHEGPSSAETADFGNTWDPEPLRQAGMTDLVDLISQSKGAPPHTWLPHVASEMFQAQMSCQGLMEWMAGRAPQDIVQCIAALDEIFPLPEGENNSGWGGAYSPGNAATIAPLIMYTARHQGPESAPVVAVALRRANIGAYVETFLAHLATWHLEPTLQATASRLRSAELGIDANNMLRYVGSRKKDVRAMEVVRYFDKANDAAARDLVLAGMAQASADRFMIAATEIESEEMRQVLISAIPFSNRNEYAEALESAGLKEMADQIRVPSYSDEPPF